MVKKRLFQKGALWALFVTLATSCSSDCCIWQCEEIVAPSPRSNSGRVYLCTGGLEVELVRYACDMRLYINVFGLEIPPDPSNPSTSRVYISFKDHSYTFSAERFIGGQRLLVPPETRDEIVKYLQSYRSVYIRVGRYEADIDPDHFNEVYDRIMARQY